MEQVDLLLLNSYMNVLDGLAEFLGTGYEIVLHSLEDLDHSAIFIRNGYHSGRKTGAPITDLALEMLRQIKKSGDNHHSMIYTNRSRNGVPIHSATIPITGINDQIIGLVCINFYMDLPFHTLIESFFPQVKTSQLMESFSGSSEELIENATNEAKLQVMNESSIKQSNKNKEIINTLYKKDIFKLKNAVDQVASILNISRNTVYLHLRNISSDTE